MTDFAIKAPTAAEREAGKLSRFLAFTGGDVPPSAVETSGPMENGYFFRQHGPLAIWVIEHELEAYPDVTVQATLGEAGIVRAEWVSDMQLHLIFSEPCEGYAELTTDA